MIKFSKTGCEITECGRCGGSGKYSFNLMHGSTCYGCGGTGWALTKRGKVAAAFSKSLKAKPASEVQVGDLVLFDMFFHRSYARVTKIERGENSVTLHGVRTKTGESMAFQHALDTPTIMGFTAEEKAEQIKKVREYQDTLDEKGKPLPNDDAAVLAAAEYYTQDQ